MTVKKNTNLKIAFIGAGNMAEAHMQAFADIDNIFLAGVTSRTLEKAERLTKKFQGLNVYTSIAELYETTKADLVVIAVNELSLYDVCVESFKYPWKIMIEKPIGYNYDEAKLIKKLADLHRAQVFVALNRRYYSSTQNVTESLKSVEGQRIVHVFDQENPDVVLEMGWPKKVVDNWMYANSIHLIDYFNLFCRGELTAVNNVIRLKNSSPFFLLSTLSFSSGDIGIYQAIWEGPGPWAVTVSTQSKFWELKPLEKVTEQIYRNRNKEDGVIHQWDIAFKPGLRAQAQNAVNAVLDEQHSLPTLDDGLNLMFMIKKIYEV